MPGFGQLYLCGTSKTTDELNENWANVRLGSKCLERKWIWLVSVF